MDHPAQHPNSVSSIAYRADIDGLRAIAVIAVVLFHAFPGAARGGFVGVDIFFVISGYLITSIISREIENGTYSTLKFYERRLRRIAPAFMVVCLFCLILASFLYVPQDFEIFGESLLASVLIHANIFFFKEAGYFFAPADVLPLLHIWSLSVEEQFYIFFPIVLVFASRTRFRDKLILAILAISFVASCVGVFAAPEAAFYLTPFRAWELLIGAALALGAVPKTTGKLAEILSWVGAALIITAIWGLSEASLFPGWNALLPCLGAALLIHAGQQPTVNRLLSSTPMVAIGLISYSLYLWHWPLLSFAAYIAMRPLTFVETIAVVTAAFVLAWLSYRFVEQPFRRSRSRRILFPIFAGAALLTVAALIADGTKGASWRLSDQVAAMTTGDAIRIGMPHGNCGLGRLEGIDSRLAPLNNAPRSIVCRLGAEGVAPTVVIWGDSHGDAVAPALDAVLKHAGKAGYSFSRGGCPPIMGIDRQERPTWRCAEFAERVFEVLTAMKPEQVIIAARWAYYFEGTRNANIRGPSPVFSPDGNFDAVSAGLSTSLAKVSELGSSLTLMTSIPEIAVHVSSTLGRAAILHRDADIAPTRLEFEHRQARSRTELVRQAERLNARILSPEDYLCDSQICAVTRDGKSLYVDYNHLSQAGAATLVPMFERIFAPNR